jgi:hypothetical protein
VPVAQELKREPKAMGFLLERVAEHDREITMKNIVGGSLSSDDWFEAVAFKPHMSAHYTFKINRYAMRDTANNIRLGVPVNFFND